MNFFPTGPKSIWIMGKHRVWSQDKTSNKQVMLFILFFWSRVSVPHMQHSRKKQGANLRTCFPQSHILSLKISWLEVIAVPKRGVWISLPDLLLLGGRRGGTVAEHWQRLIRADERNQRLRWRERTREDAGKPRRLWWSTSESEVRLAHAARFKVALHACTWLKLNSMGFRKGSKV